MPDLLPKRGRPGVVFLMSVTKHLTHADVLRLALEPPAKVAAPMIQRLKTSHHTAARLVAQGLDHAQIAVITGYSKQRISDLATTDPAFQDLVAHYADQIDEIGVEDANRVSRRLVDVGETSLIEIQERLADDNKRAKIPLGELRQLVELGLDRTIAPPKTATPTVSVPAKITFNIGARDLRPQEPKDVTPQVKEIEHEQGS